MKPSHTPDIFGHQPKTKELPPLNFDLSGIKPIEKIIRDHLPNAKREPVIDTIPGEPVHDTHRQDPRDVEAGRGTADDRSADGTTT